MEKDPQHRAGRCRTFASVLAASAVLALSVAAVLGSGILVRPTEASLADRTEVPRYDVLDSQAARDREILSDYAQGTYTLDRPYVLVDPYGMNPCSALVLFETDRPSDVSVTVEGDGAASTFRYTVPAQGRHVEVPVLYLYAGRETRVVLDDGRGGRSRLAIRTEPLPVDFQTYDLVVSTPDRMEPGLTLCTACFEDSYTALLDADAQVRGYLSHRRMAHGTRVLPLEGGRFLATGDEYRQVPYNMTSLWECDWLGKVHREYEVPNGIHHGLSLLPDGDILAASNRRDLFAAGTREDVAVVVDRDTGAILREYDFRTILDDARAPFHPFDPGILNAPNVDWMHMNAAVAGPSDDTLLVSSPIQSQVACIDAESGEVLWILGPHDGYGTGRAAGLADRLLRPVGAEFAWSWGQHDPRVLPDQDGDPGTIDLLLLDNGPYRSFTAEGAVAAADNHSRGVQYRIDPEAMTVLQVWEYGRERGSECYATYLGSADRLPATGNRLLAFGGQLRSGGMPVDDIVGGVLGEVVTQSRIVEVTETGEAVFEVAVTGNPYSPSAETYQASRLPVPDTMTGFSRLGEEAGVRLGESSTAAATREVLAPPLYFGQVGAGFSRFENENGRLVVDGDLTYRGRTFLLGKAWVVLRSRSNVFVYPADSGLNGRFFASIGTSALPAGTYGVSVVGIVREGRDASRGKTHRGHFRTGFRVTVG